MMSLVEVLLMAVALSVDSLVVAAAATVQSRLSVRRLVLMASVFAVVQGVLPWLGAMLGGVFQQGMESVDHWVAFGLLVAVGGKMVWDGVRGAEEGRRLDASRLGVMCVRAVGTSIDAFVLGVGMGLSMRGGRVWPACALIGLVTFGAALLGGWLGRRSVVLPARLTSVVAGTVLIGLAVRTLFEHGVVA